MKVNAAIERKGVVKCRGWEKNLPLGYPLRIGEGENKYLHARRHQLGTLASCDLARSISGHCTFRSSTAPFRRQQFEVYVSS